MAQRASARALLDLLSHGQNQSPLVPNEATAKRRAELDARVATANRRLQEAGPAEDLTALRMELRHARAEREIFDAEAASNEGSPLSRTSLELENLGPLLKEGENVVLKFVVARDRTFIFVIHAQEGKPSLQAFSLDLGRAELARRAAGFRTLLAERGLDWQQPARALYATLLEPSEPIWKDASSLTIIPDGPLWELPFQALQNAQQHCLLEHHVVSYAPSVAFLAQARNKMAGPAVERLFALGDPALSAAKGQARAAAFFAPMIGESWKPLPAADEQLAELKKLYSPTESLVLTGAAAREDTFKERAGAFDILHLATHGVMNDHAPLYSYLLLSQQDLAPNEDGLLEAWELMRMKLHAQLAVLSACETARGRISDGEGIIGLAWAFLAAGCPAEVVSQWKVDSEVDRDLMVDFHRRLRAGTSTAQALRQASLEVAKKHRHPFYWAPFVFIGRN